MVLFVAQKLNSKSIGKMYREADCKTVHCGVLLLLIHSTFYLDSWLVIWYKLLFEMHFSKCCWQLLICGKQDIKHPQISIFV